MTGQRRVLNDLAFRRESARWAAYVPMEAGSAKCSGMRELEYQSSRCMGDFLPPSLAIGAQEM